METATCIFSITSSFFFYVFVILFSTSSMVLQPGPLHLVSPNHLLGSVQLYVWYVYVCRKITLQIEIINTNLLKCFLFLQTRVLFQILHWFFFPRISAFLNYSCDFFLNSLLKVFSHFFCYFLSPTEIHTQHMLYYLLGCPKKKKNLKSTPTKPHNLESNI